MQSPRDPTGRLGELGAAPSPSLSLGITLGSGLKKAGFGSGAKAKLAFALGGAAVLAPAPFLRPGSLMYGKRWISPKFVVSFS